jgi:tetratricopeptide (TPR) repeat protein
MKLILSALSFLLTAFPLFAQNASAPREQLKQLTTQLQSSPGDDALREKIIKLALTLDPEPAMPEEAERFMARGTAAVKDAKTDQDFKDAAAEFEKATVAAPWLANAYYNLAVAESKAGDYAGAARNLRFYLLVAPNAPDAKDAKNLMYEMEYKQEKAGKDRAEQARREEELARKKREEDARAAKLQDLEGEWLSQSGVVMIRISHSGSSYQGDIPDNGVWTVMHFQDGSPGKSITTLKSFSSSGKAVFYATEGWIKQDKSRQSFGPWRNNYNLTLSSDGMKLEGTNTTATNLGTSNSQTTLYRKQ